ncbi:MAG: hypothetical protein ACOY3Y_19265, partial [Acidobacteriota bacterium]
VAHAAAEAQRGRAALRAEGEAARRARMDEARSRATERLAALSGELDAASQAARVDLRGRVQDLSRLLAERLVGRRLAS